MCSVNISNIHIILNLFSLLKLCICTSRLCEELMNTRKCIMVCFVENVSINGLKNISTFLHSELRKPKAINLVGGGSVA